MTTEEQSRLDYARQIINRINHALDVGDNATIKRIEELQNEGLTNAEIIEIIDHV